MNSSVTVSGAAEAITSNSSTDIWDARSAPAFMLPPST